MYTFDEFAKSEWSLVVCKEGTAFFRSKDSDLEPLVRYLAEHETNSENVTVYDKYTGRAAALLMALVMPDMVYTGTISDGGVEVLNEHNIRFQAGDRVRYLMGIASDGMCRWEKMAVGKTPLELLGELRKVYGHLFA